MAISTWGLAGKMSSHERSIFHVTWLGHFLDSPVPQREKHFNVSVRLGRPSISEHVGVREAGCAHPLKDR